MFEKQWKHIIRREGLSLYAIPAFFLWIVSLFFRLGSAIYRTRKRHQTRIDIPVVCIGNITVGGTGKTPMVAFLGRFLLNDGFRVGIVSSGYGRTSPEQILDPGYKVRQMDSSSTGDEVRLLAELLPEAIFSVAEKKVDAASHLAGAGGVDVVIVDDGFQHFELARDVDIVTYDGGIEERLLKPFPYGVLREPMSALKRADVIVITRSKFVRDLRDLQQELRAINPEADCYSASFSADQLIGREQTMNVKYLEDKSVFLFAGVGNFRTLERQVTALCGDLDFALELDDHQRYDDALLRHIKQMADKHDSDLILTTGKDWVKLGNFDFDREIYYLNQTIDLDPGEEKLIAYLQERLNLNKQTS
jgi:tetraacyldisaccharide 4'-kinase